MRVAHRTVFVLASLAATAFLLVACVAAYAYPSETGPGPQQPQAEPSLPGTGTGRLPTAEVSGRVLAPDGTPAAGVAVSVRPQWPVASLGPAPVTYSPGIHWRDRSDARTDGRGEFVIRGVRLGPAAVVAEHESLGDAAVDLDVGASANRVEMRLDRSGRIQGRVVDEHGEPVASALVRLSRDPAPEEASDAGSPHWPPRHGELGVYSTGDDGRFLFQRLEAGEYRLKVTAQGLAQGGPPETVTAGKAPVTGVELVLSKGGEIHGRLLGLAADETWPVTGEATFDGVPAGDWPVSVSAEGTARVGVDVSLPGPPVAVTLPPPTVLEILVPDLEEVLYLPLVLTGPDGRVPAAGRVGMGTMLARGRSRIDNLPPGTWTATIEAPDGREYQGTATTAPDRPARLVLESPTAAVVSPE